MGRADFTRAEIHAGDDQRAARGGGQGGAARPVQQPAGRKHGRGVGQDGWDSRRLGAARQYLYILVGGARGTFRFLRPHNVQLYVITAGCRRRRPTHLHSRSGCLRYTRTKRRSCTRGSRACWQTGGYLYVFSSVCKSLYVAYEDLLHEDVRGYERPLVLLGVRLALHSSANIFLTHS